MAMKEKQVPYTPPQLGMDAFNCPSCGAFAHQEKWPCIAGYGSAGVKPLQRLPFALTICSHCAQIAIWHNDSLIFPLHTIAPSPAPDVPDDVRADFEEARYVFTHSPRAAAALLRLALQRLMSHLNQTGTNLNADIAALVRQGLPPRTQQALDSVRVIGNNAVHPGQIDLNDDPATALSLFTLLNFIVEKMITDPKELKAIYDALPATSKEAIADRDRKP
jgi:hypothetical protein